MRHRARRFLGAIALFLGALFVLAGGGETGAVPGASPDEGAAERLPGRWTTFANGDDVLALAADGDVLWAATRGGGLVRWEGEGYAQYLRPQDPIGGNQVRDVAVDERGWVWLATDGGLSVLDDGGTADKADDRWWNHTVQSSFGGLPSDDVRALALDGETVWVGTAQVQDLESEAWVGGGLARLDAKGTFDVTDDEWAEVQTFANTYVSSPTGDDELGLVSDNILALALNESGDLWIATTRHRLLEQVTVGEIIRTEWLRAHGGISFVETQGTFDPADDVWTATDCEKMQETVTCTVQDLAIDAGGTAWAAVGGRGLVYFSANNGLIIDERSRLITPPERLTGDYVDAIAFGPPGDPARENEVWLAMRKGGLNVVDHGGSLRNKNDDLWNDDRLTPYTTADGLARDRVQALAMDGDRLWLGLGPELGLAGGLQALRLDDRTIESARRTERAPVGNFLTDVAFGEAGSRWEGRVWLTSGSRAQRRYGAGASVLDARGTSETRDDVWVHYDTRGTDDDGAWPWTGLAGDNVQTVALRGDEVWLGSVESTWNRDEQAYADGGLSMFDGEEWTVRTVEGTGGADDGLRDGSVSSVVVGCEEGIWVGTGNRWDAQGAGIDVLFTGANPHVQDQDAWTHHDYVDKAAQDSLPSRNITDLSVSCASRRVWASGAHHVRLPEQGSPGGTLEGGGVSVYDLDTGDWRRFDSRHGLESFHTRGDLLAEAMTVLAGPGESAWVGTYGTSDTDTASLVNDHPYWPAVLNHFDGADWSHDVFARAGMVSAIARDGEGRLWVGTSRGGAAREADNPENWRYDRQVGGLMIRDEDGWFRLDVVGSGLPSNDIAAIEVAPDGTVWLATEGGGALRFEPGAENATATPTSRGASPTPSATPTRIGTPDEPTPTVDPFASPSATPSATRPRPTRPVDGEEIYLPVTLTRPWSR